MPNKRAGGQAVCPPQPGEQLMSTLPRANEKGLEAVQGRSSENYGVFLVPQVNRGLLL